MNTGKEISMPDYYWHFSRAEKNGRPVLAFMDGREIRTGITHKTRGPIVLCKSGFHASKKAIDALQHANGRHVSLVILSGKVIHGGDKSVASERTYIKTINCEKVLQKFARDCALDVAHLWECPSIVREFLETGRKEIRVAVWEAVRAANLIFPPFEAPYQLFPIAIKSS